MKKILLFLLLIFPVLLFAQYPTTGNKQRLGWQTTGDGLVYRDAGPPSYTPNSRNNAYIYLDTIAKRYYHFSSGAWRYLSAEKYIRLQDVTVGAAAVADSLITYDRLFYAADLTSGASSDKAVQLPIAGLDSTYAGRVVRLSVIDSSATYDYAITSSSPDGLLVGDTLATSYSVENGETAEFQLYVFDTIYQWRLIHTSRADSLILPDSLAYGTGTTNYLSRWIAPFTLGTAGISDDGSEIQFARPTVLYGVNTAAPATYGTFGIDNTLGIERPTFYNGSAWIPWLAYSGAANQYSYFSNSNTITSNTQLFRSSTGVEIGDGNYFKLPSNSTVGSQLGSTAGRMEFNNTAQNLSFRTSTATEYPVKSSYSTGLFTATRVPYADANGRLTDDPDLTFDGTTLSTGTTGNIRGAVGRIVSNAGRCNSPEGGIARVSGTGAIQINLPTGVFGGGGALRQFAVSFDVVVTKYVGGTTQASDRVTFIINGDNSPGIYQAYAYSVGTGNNMQGLTWRVGISGSGGVVRVFLGELSSSIGPNVVSVENVSYANIFGTSANISELCNGWSVSLQSSSFGTISRSGLVIPQYGRIYNFSNEGGLTIHRDVNAFHRARYQGSFSGAHEITLPPATANLTGNVPFQIRGGLVYGSIANLREFIIEGVYNYASKNFFNCSATWLSGTPSSLPIRFGDDGTNGKIWIGALNPPDAASTAWSGSFLYIYGLATYNISQSAHQDFFNNFPALQTESTAFNNIDITIPAYPSGVIPYSSSLGFTYSSDFLKTATQFKAGNYTFNTDQSVGAGQNGYVQTYNHSTGEIELQSPPASYTGFTPAADSGTGSNVGSGGTLTSTGGYGINTSVSGTTVTIEADTSELATQYDLTQLPPNNVFTNDGTITDDFRSIVLKDSSDLYINNENGNISIAVQDLRDLGIDEQRVLIDVSPTAFNRYYGVSAVSKADTAQSYAQIYGQTNTNQTVIAVSSSYARIAGNNNSVAFQYDLMRSNPPFPNSAMKWATDGTPSWFNLDTVGTNQNHVITRTIVDGDGALPDSTVTVNGTFNAGFWRVPESMDGYTLTKASFGIFDKGDLATTGATYSFGVTKCDGDNANCSNSSSVNFTPSSERELELSTSITLNANDILRVNYQPPQGCGGGCGTENVNGLVVTYTIQQN